MNRDVIAHAAVVVTTAIVTYFVLPVAFVGKAPPAQGKVDIRGHTTVIDLLGADEADLPFYLKVARSFARLSTLRFVIVAATVIVLGICLATKHHSRIVSVVHAILIGTMLLALWVQAIGILMCVG